MSDEMNDSELLKISEEQLVAIAAAALFNVEEAKRVHLPEVGLKNALNRYDRLKRIMAMRGIDENRVIDAMREHSIDDTLQRVQEDALTVAVPVTVKAMVRVPKREEGESEADFKRRLVRKLLTDIQSAPESIWPDYLRD